MKITVPKLRICKLCKVPKSISQYYLLGKKKQPDSYCKECRKQKRIDEERQRVDKKCITVIKYYNQWFQFDYNQKHSLAVFAMIDKRLWPLALDYINTNWKTNYNYKEAYLFITRIRSYISRYFTFKKCHNCKEIKQTYVNSHNAEYVYQMLTDTSIPIIEKDFIKTSNRDGWSNNCRNCAAVLYKAKQKNNRLPVTKKFLDIPESTM